MTLQRTAPALGTDASVELSFSYRMDARRIGTTVPGNRVETESNCLGWEKAVHLLIGVRC
jgi:hypothetical protein